MTFSFKLLPDHAPTLRDNDSAWLAHSVSRDEVTLLTVLYGSCWRVYSICTRKKFSLRVLLRLLLAVRVYRRDPCAGAGGAAHPGEAWGTMAVVDDARYEVIR